MIKKLLVLLVLVVCAAVVHQASAVIVGNNTKLYWRDNFGAPNDSYIEAAPGDTVFAAVWVNNNQWSACRNTRMTMWWDTLVLDDPTAEYLPYAHLKDYRSGGGFIPGGLPWEGSWVLDFGGSNIYIYTLGVDTGGAPLAPSFPWVATYGADAGGRLLGYYIPISSSAVPCTTTYFNVLVQGMSAWGSSWVWSEELSDTVNTDWALEIKIVPEPATMSLLAVGGVLGLIRRKK